MHAKPRAAATKSQRFSYSKRIMKQFIAFVKKETKHILRDKRTMLLLFGMPLALMLLFGFAITNDVKNVRVVVVTANNDHQIRADIERLSQSEYFTIVNTVGTPQEAERMIRSQKADMCIVPKVQPNAEGNVRVSWQILVDGCDPNMAQQWATYAQQTLLSNPSSNNAAANGQVNSAIKGQSSIVSQKLLYNPQMRSAYNFVPAIMGMLLMLICAMMTSISVVREKEKGTMEVLLVSPTKPLMVIIAKAVPYLVLAFGILTIILLMARYVLGVPLQGSLFWIYFISTIYILLALSLGLLVSNIADSQLVALLVCAMVLLMPIVMLSGMLFPIESMPEILQWVSAIIPPRYYISAMRKLMIMGVGVQQVLREMLILVAMLAFLLTLALKNFKVRLEH